MPVSFYVDPAILEDVNAKDVTDITLSYTFFRAESDTETQASSTARNATEAGKPSPQG